MKKLPNSCPFCEGKIVISEIKCEQCDTKISSDFKVSANSCDDIEDEIMEFIKIFIYTEGNISQSAKLLNCSYPKIKNFLKKAKLGLGFKEEKKKNTTDISSVIDMLESGDIDVAAALDKIGKS